jgi:hypothetical protein
VKLTTLLIVLLSHDGYWFGDRAGEIRFESSPLAPPGRVTWVLMYGPVRVSSGALDVAPGKSASVRVTSPAVRTRTNLRLVYKLADAAGNELESGETAVRIFPDDLFNDAARTLNGKALAVWGMPDDPLAAFLDRARVPHVAATGVELRLGRPGVILFGPGVLSAIDPAVRPSVEAFARRGASVVVFRQDPSVRLNGYALVRRTSPPRMMWRGDHPLLAPFGEEDLAALVPPGSAQIAVRLPVDEPALELGWWPAEAPSNEPGPVDALVVTKSIGRGRLVLCQLPFGGDWTNDVRGQVFLRAALEYAATPPGPTPRPTERRDVMHRGENAAADDAAAAARRARDERDILAPRGN